jgi:hypothetical protein
MDKVDWKRKAKEILFSLDMNTCVCDCIPCKTVHCSQCELHKFPPYKQNELCCENDLTGVISVLKEVYLKGVEDGKRE